MQNILLKISSRFLRCTIDYNSLLFWNRGEVWNCSHIVLPPGSSSRVYVDTLWFDGISPQTSNFSPVFSWLLTAVYFISPFEIKCRAPPSGRFPWFLLWGRDCAPLILYSLLSLHWSLCWVRVGLFYWTQNFLRARIMCLEHGGYIRNTNRLMFNGPPTQGKAGTHL